MKKIRVYTILCYLITILLLVIGLGMVSSILVSKSSRDKVQNFRTDVTNKDILLIGTSHISNAIIPLELWNNYGYTSYVLYAGYDDMERNIMILRQALQYSTPKLVVLDVENYWDKSEADVSLNDYHKFVDDFPLTKEKVATTLELYPDSESRSEIIFPLVRYHDRWKELKSEDFAERGEVDFLKGAILFNKVCPVENYRIVPKEEGVLRDSYAIETLRKFISYCQERDIQVLVTTIPYGADEERQSYMQGIHNMLDEWNVDHQNLIELELVNPDTDYYNESHLNVWGADKITDYLGEYIHTHYEIPDRRAEKCAVIWNQEYEQYVEFRNEELTAE